jgi:hypothetical protein
MILPSPRGKVTDHSDGNRANNCRSNLRVCNRSENSHNRRKPSGASSAYQGVFYNRERHKWGAKCRRRGGPIWTGFFDTEEEAARAYDRKAVELFGEFARLNFPREWPPERRAEVHAQRQVPETRRKGDRQQVKSRTGRRARTPRVRRGERVKGGEKKAKVKRKDIEDKTGTARAGTRGRREQKRSTKPARARAAKSGRKGKM